MKKSIKILAIAIMLLGIVFSVSNFLSVELRAGLRGIWSGDFGSECERIGNECDIAFFGKP